MRKFGARWPTRLQCADFRSIFASSASAVTFRERSSINTNRKSTTRFPMSLKWTSYVAPNHQRVAQKCKVSKIWTIGCDNSDTVRDRKLITNRKSHTGFRMMPSSMTLNDLERRNSPYFAFFTECDCRAGKLRHRGWWQSYNSAEYCIYVPVFHFWPKLIHSGARSLCDSWASRKHSNMSCLILM